MDDLRWRLICAVAVVGVAGAGAVVVAAAAGSVGARIDIRS